MTYMTYRPADLPSHYPAESDSPDGMMNGNGAMVMRGSVNMQELMGGKMKRKAAASAGTVLGLQGQEDDYINNAPALPYVPVDDFQLFEKQNGSECLGLVKALCRRHHMTNPLEHPKEPFVHCFEETWSPLTASRDPEGETIVSRIAAALKAKGTKFEDPTFPANKSSLFADVTKAAANENASSSFRTDQDVFLAGQKGIEWKRPNEWGMKEKFVVWSGGVDPDDVKQGVLGNCYLLAAMAGCAIGDEDILLKDLCIEEYADQGMYGIKFFINGKWKTVLIDDRIPCQQKRNGQWKPIFSQPCDHSGQRRGEIELWPMLFEKVFLCNQLGSKTCTFTHEYINKYVYI